MDNIVISEKLIDAPNHVRLPLLAGLYASDADPAPFVEVLCGCLDDADESLRSMAMMVMERCGSEAVAPLSDLLSPARTAQTRASAAVSLGRMGSVAAAASGALCQCLREEDETLRRHAAFALGSIGESALPGLQRLLFSDDREVVLAAIEALGAMGPAAVAAGDDIRRLAESEDLLIKTSCAGCLARMDHTDPQGVPQLMAAMTHFEADARVLAVRWIGKMGEKGAAAVPQLIDRLRDDEGQVRAEAALALARVEPAPEEAVEPLIVLLEDGESQALVHAAIALGTIGAAANIAIGPLEKLQNHTDERIAQVAGAALTRIRSGARLTCREQRLPGDER